VNRRIATGVVAAAAVALGAVVAAGPIGSVAHPTPALAQDQGGPGQGPGGPRQGPDGGRRGPDGGRQGPGGQRQGPDGQRQGGGPLAAGMRATMQAVADSLGMTPQDVMQQLRQGQSLADVAAAHGVDQATLLQTISGAARTQLDQAVGSGALTRGQADALLNVLQQFGPQIVTRTGPAGGPLGFRGGPGARRGGPGQRQGHRGFRGGDRAAVVRPVADLLGMSPREIFEARQQGQSLAAIAAAKGVDQATLVQTITGAIKSGLDQAVAAGRLPQDRADAIYQRAQQEVPQMVARTEMPNAQRGPRGPRDGQRPDGSPRGPRGGTPSPTVPVQ
jgi:uncharacterized protein (DUF433 family)